MKKRSKKVCPLPVDEACFYLHVSTEGNMLRDSEETYNKSYVSWNGLKPGNKR